MVNDCSISNFFTCLCNYTNSFSHSLFPLFLPFLFAALIGIMYQAIAENFLDEHLEIFYDNEKITFISSKLGKKEILFSQIKFFAIYRNKGAFASISFSMDIQENGIGAIKKYVILIINSFITMTRENKVMTLYIAL